MTRWRTLGLRSYHHVKRLSDLRLITFIALFVAAGSPIGCSPNAPNPAEDAAIDAGHRPDSSVAADGVAGDDALDDDDAPRGLVILPAQFTEENMPLRMLNEGDLIDLWPAPQGGHVVLVAAKVKNLIGDSAILSVRARYPDTPFIIALEGRSVKFVPVPDEPGTMQPDLRTRTQVAHIPLCPDYDPWDIVDRPLEFEITVTTMSEEPQTGTVTLRLHPSCAASHDPPFCKCECRAEYFLGKCARDAGASD